jgi:thioredoxin-like negative regulator of GroEL
VDADNWEAAFELLLAELEAADDLDARDELRQLMVALFGELGQDHPITIHYRRRLATALY